jgi:hypothetical protein
MRLNLQIILPDPAVQGGQRDKSMSDHLLRLVTASRNAYQISGQATHRPILQIVSLLKEKTAATVAAAVKTHSNSRSFPHPLGFSNRKLCLTMLQV